MAISRPHYYCLKDLHSSGQLPQAGSILEIGEANIYSDIDLDEIRNDIQEIPDEGRRNRVSSAFESQVAGGSPQSLFAIAKLIYQMLFVTRDVVSIDWHGTGAALRLDLNQPINLGRRFETVINHGTAEHVFNIANVFKAIHDHCAVDGLMIHESPFTGWVDHGFYCLQPTLFWDLAAVNEYEVVEMAIECIDPLYVRGGLTRDEIHGLAAGGELPANAMLWAALRKKFDRPFRLPMQGYYAKTISAGANKAWMELR